MATEVEIAQFYETELQDRRTGLAIRFATLPTPSIASAGVLQEPFEVMHVLELEQLSAA